MAYMYIQISAPNMTVAQLNDKVSDSTKPFVGMNQLENLICAIEGGLIPASVTVVTSPTSETISAGTGGVSATYNLT